MFEKHEFCVTYCHQLYLISLSMIHVFVPYFGSREKPQEMIKVGETATLASDTVLYRSRLCSQEIESLI